MPTYKWPKKKNDRGYARDKQIPSANLPKPSGGRPWITSEDSTFEHPLLWCDGCGSAFEMHKDEWYNVDAPSRIGVLCKECADADVDRAKTEGRLKLSKIYQEAQWAARVHNYKQDLVICETNTHSDTKEVFNRLYKR